MSKRRRDLVQIIVLVVILIAVIVIVILIYVFRFSLFGPTDLTQYGTYGDPQISTCEVQNTTAIDTRCTDVGVEVTIQQCIPNPTTGYMCWDGSEQVATSKVTVTPCTPACTSFMFSETLVTPCLANIGEVPFPTGVTYLYSNPDQAWCNTLTDGVRFRTFQCNTHDGSGLNLCTFICDGNTFNADCFPVGNTSTSSNGTTLLYNPALVPQNNTLDFVINNGLYEYTPVSKASVVFPVIASNNMVTQEKCTDLAGVTCGNWFKSTVVNGVIEPDTTLNNNFQFLDSCSLVRNISAASGIGYNNGTKPYNYDGSTFSTAYDMFEPGIDETLLTCFNQDNTVTGSRCLPNTSNCINSANIFQPSSTNGPNNILSAVPSGSNTPTPICGVATTNSQNIITGITKNLSILGSCIFANTNFSINPNKNNPGNLRDSPLVSTTLIIDSKGDTIFGVPLFMVSMTNPNRPLYLSLMNTPCPQYQAEIIDGAYQFTFLPDGKFLFGTLPDFLPPTGIPFIFDCQGNANAAITSVPCSWIQDYTTNPATIWGLDPNCNIRNDNISPVMEQSALTVFIRPARLALFETVPTGFTKINIFAIFGNNYIGWLNIVSNQIGYPTFGSNILTWNQGRFDPYGNAIDLFGTRIDDLPNSAFYISLINPSNFLYLLTGAPIQTPINVFDGANNNIVPLGVFSFRPATTQGNSLIDVLNDGTNELDNTNFANFLYSRGNRGSFTTIPACNALLDKNINN